MDKETNKHYINHIFDSLHSYYVEYRLCKSKRTKKRLNTLIAEYLRKYKRFYRDICKQEKLKNVMFDDIAYLNMLDSIDIKNVFTTPLCNFKNSVIWQPDLFGFLT